MGVTSTKEYTAEPADLVEYFGGNQLLFVSWDRHLIFAGAFSLPVPPDMRFGDLVRGPISDLIAPDPDAEKIDWTQVQWLKSNRPFVPDFAKSLKENGIRHKEQLRFQTPGLNSVLGFA